jgi:guanylate kinase
MEYNDRYERIPDLQFGRSVTTRAPRESDRTSAKQYDYVDLDGFEELILDGQIIEYAPFAGNFYGTPRPDPSARTLLEIEVQGAAALATSASAHLVFLTAPGCTDEERLAIIESRLCARESIEPKMLERRLNQARAELVQGPAQSHKVVVNEDPYQAAHDILDAMSDFFYRAYV